MHPIRPVARVMGVEQVTQRIHRVARAMRQVVAVMPEERVMKPDPAQGMLGGILEAMRVIVPEAMQLTRETREVIAVETLEVTVGT